MRRPEIVEPKPVRKLEAWELALNQWDAQPNGLVGAAKAVKDPKMDDQVRPEEPPMPPRKIDEPMTHE